MKSRRCLIAWIVCLKLVCAIGLGACGRAPVEVGDADYSTMSAARGCVGGEKPGAAGLGSEIRTPSGLRINVRTPGNYDSTRTHPLLIVYAPAGRTRLTSEFFSGLTLPATSAGFIVAYADHVPMKLRNFEILGEVPLAVTEQWCVDSGRIFAAGHSDGGLAAEAIVFLQTSTLPIAGLVASGAGIRGKDLNAYACPPPRRVMIVHSRDDRRFPLPAYGREAADWWAKCNGCQTERVSRRDANCLEYSACAPGATTNFCETSGGHARWPGLNAELLRFISFPVARSAPTPTDRVSRDPELSSN